MSLKAPSGAFLWHRFRRNNTLVKLVENTKSRYTALTKATVSIKFLFIILPICFAKVKSRQNRHALRSLKMKIKSILMSTVIAASALTMTTTYAGNTTNTALTSALGGVVGAAIGNQMGGQTGAMIGSAIGGGAGAAASANKRDRNGAIIGGALGGAGGYTVGKNMGGTNGGYIGAGLGSAGGAVLGKKVSEDRRYDDEYDRRYDNRYDRHYDSRGYRNSNYKYNGHDYRGDNGRHLGWYKNGKR